MIENLEGEIWKDIDGYEGLYQVSNLGRIKSLSRYILNTRGAGYRKIKGVIIKTHIMPNGYEHIVLHKNGKQYNDYVHRLVAKAFIPNPNNLPQVNHKDEDKENNRVDNLEWCTVKYNNCYGTKLERQSKGMKEYIKCNGHPMKGKKGKHGKENKNSIPIYCLTTNEYFDNAIEAMNKYNIDNSSILKCCKNKSKYAGETENGCKMLWCYYYDYINMSETEIKDKLNLMYDGFIIDINNKKIFKNVIECGEYYNKNIVSILDCCKGKQNTVILKNKTKTKFMYYKEYLKQAS